MTRLISVVLLTTTALAQQAALAQQGAMRSVYILPMAGGLDQYLAEQIARDHVMQVVADPKLADAIMTERLNEALGQTLAKLHPRDEDDDATGEIHRTFRTSSSNGMIFLVDTKSRQVIWSDYEKPPRSASGVHLNQEAGRIVKKLQDTLGK